MAYTSCVNDVLPSRRGVEDLAWRSDEIYDRDILPKLRPEDEGKIIAIDIETGDYEFATDELTAAHALRARRPDAQIWFRRVGSRYLHRFGQRREEVEALSTMRGMDLADPVVMSGAWRS